MHGKEEHRRWSLRSNTGEGNVWKKHQEQGDANEADVEGKQIGEEHRKHREERVTLS